MDENLVGWDNTYDRVGRKHGTVYYTLEIYAGDADSTAHMVSLDISAREDLGKTVIEDALQQ